MSFHEKTGRSQRILVFSANIPSRVCSKAFCHCCYPSIRNLSKLRDRQQQQRVRHSSQLSSFFSSNNMCWFPIVFRQSIRTKPWVWSSRMFFSALETSIVVCSLYS